MVERLIKARLLVADRRSGADVVEIAHESLLRQWSTLMAWLQADADDLKLIDGIERAAREWETNGRDETWLVHSGRRLDEAQRISDWQRRRRRSDDDREGLPQGMLVKGAWRASR